MGRTISPGGMPIGDGYRETGKQLFKWPKEQNGVFGHSELAFINPPVLALPHPDEMFILDTDASNIAIAAELCLVQNNQERVAFL